MFLLGKRVHGSIQFDVNRIMNLGKYLVDYKRYIYEKVDICNSVFAINNSIIFTLVTHRLKITDVE